MQVWDVGPEEAAKATSIEQDGHQSGVRAAALSSDDSLLLTVAAEGVKVSSSGDLSLRLEGTLQALS